MSIGCSGTRVASEALAAPVWLGSQSAAIQVRPGLQMPSIKRAIRQALAVCEDIHHDPAISVLWFDQDIGDGRTA